MNAHQEYLLRNGVGVMEYPEPAPETTQPTAFKDIYQLYSGRVLNLAYRFTREEEAAKDLTQDIFLKVYQHRESFREEAQLYTWIHRIALNHIMNYLRVQRRSRWYDIMDESISSLLHTATSSQSGHTPSPTPHQIMEKSEREKIIWNAIESLAAKYRVPFVLFRFEGMSYQQIADAMNLTLSAVEARIHRAKKQLIVKLEPLIDHI